MPIIRKLGRESYPCAMNMRIIPLLFLAFSLGQLRLRAEEVATLKPEYSESSTNGTKAITLKRWQTRRNGKVVIKHEERDLHQDGEFDQVDTLIFHDDKKVLHLMTFQGKKTCFFYPESGLAVTQSDSDDQGQYDRIVLNDAKKQIVDCFIKGADGRLVAISDEELKKVADALNSFSEKMRDFDKRLPDK
jgi:hypothetical protein